MKIKHMIKTIIVDDERLARRGLQIILQDFPQFQVVGEAANITQTINLIKREKPTLIFLDIQLGG